MLTILIRRYCNNLDDLSKIMSVCECLLEVLEVEPSLKSPALTVNQLLARSAAPNK